MRDLDPAPPIRARGLSHWFGDGEARKQALHDLDFDVARGALTVLMGASGSGKTTLLTLLGGLRAVQAGSARVLGIDLAGAGEPDLRALRRRVGFIFQAHNLHESLTAMQNVRMGLEVHRIEAQGRDALANWREGAAHLLGLLGLSDRLDYFPANLSGGQKQRVAVARALIGNPEIVFADEPTAALDRDSALNVVDLLKRLGRARGVTTLMVTHDSKIVDRADRILVMEDGRIVEDSAPQALA
jgi:putative ABC transport system ATP-binding protein